MRNTYHTVFVLFDELSGLTEYLESLYVAPFDSDPTVEDTDGDGLLDGKSIYVGIKKVAPADPNELLVTGPEGIWKRHIYESSDEFSIPNTLVEWAEISIDIPDLISNGKNSKIAVALSNFLMFRYDENQTVLHSQTKNDIEDMLNRNDSRTILYTYYISHITDQIIASCVFDDDRNYSKETWQKTSGYNLIYDYFFKFFTNDNVRVDYIDFSTDDETYIFWIWHGDYLNLGSGAEMGFYTNPHALKNMYKSDGTPLIKQWDAIDFEVPMRLYLYNKSENDIDSIFKWEPFEKQWWITGFNPEYYPVAETQIMIGTVDLSEHEDMFYAMHNRYTEDKFQRGRTINDASVMFEEDDKTLWVIWYEGDCIS